MFSLSAGGVSVETVQDPMQPPAFALEKFRLAKLKQSGKQVTKPVKVRKIVNRPLRLSSVLIGQSRKVAIINDKMLVVGEKIENARVVKIFKDRVQLSRDGKKFTLRLDNDGSTIRKQVVESKL